MSKPISSFERGRFAVLFDLVTANLALNLPTLALGEFESKGKTILVDEHEKIVRRQTIRTRNNRITIEMTVTRR